LAGTRLIVLAYGCRPMSEQGNKIAAVISVRAGLLGRLLALAKRSLRALDQLDYFVRHWLMQVPLEKRTRSTRDRETWIRANGLPSCVQLAIGRGLRAEYGIERSMPVQLANLLKEFEKRSNEIEAIA
jgi:hypothetical protein